MKEIKITIQEAKNIIEVFCKGMPDGKIKRRRIVMLYGKLRAKVAEQSEK